MTDKEPLYTLEQVKDIAQKLADCALMSSPPKKEWVGLTDEEIINLIHDIRWENMVVTTHYLAKAIEAKLKDKNHG